MNITGASSGEAANVTNEQLHGKAAVETRMADVSKRKELAYAWTAVSADIDTGDTALLVCNTDSAKKLHITKVYCWADTAVQFKIHLPAYAAFAGTAVTGKNLAGGGAADAVAYADETASTFAAANSILTLRNNEVGTDQFGVDWDFEGAVVLDYHEAIAVDLVGETAAFECTIFGYYE
jgi:hypothetical protein